MKLFYSPQQATSTEFRADFASAGDLKLPCCDFRSSSVSRKVGGCELAYGRERDGMARSIWKCVFNLGDQRPNELHAVLRVLEMQDASRFSAALPHRAARQVESEKAVRRALAVAAETVFTGVVHGQATFFDDRGAVKKLKIDYFRR